MHRRKENLHADITAKVIGASMTVLNDLKPGLDEKLYENALIVELTSQGLEVEQQAQFAVHYKGHFVGKLIPDLIVAGKVIGNTSAICSNLIPDGHLRQRYFSLALEWRFLYTLEHGCYSDQRHYDAGFGRRGFGGEADRTAGRATGRV
jgi:GxxExxY protein